MQYGLIALAGVTVEIGAIMLVYLNQYRDDYLDEVRQSKRSVTRAGLRQAVNQGALQRLRPVVMTMAAITAGLLQIMVGHGTGSEVMQRIAAPMIGGMITTLALTLLVIPAVYLVWQYWLLRTETEEIGSE